jgi:hypothetical protein
VSEVAVDAVLAALRRRLTLTLRAEHNQGGDSGRMSTRAGKEGSNVLYFLSLSSSMIGIGRCGADSRLTDEWKQGRLVAAPPPVAASPRRGGDVSPPEEEGEGGREGVAVVALELLLAPRRRDMGDGRSGSRPAARDCGSSAAGDTGDGQPDAEPEDEDAADGGGDSGDDGDAVGDNIARETQREGRRTAMGDGCCNSGAVYAMSLLQWRCVASTSGDAMQHR